MKKTLLTFLFLILYGAVFSQNDSIVHFDLRFKVLSQGSTSRVKLIALIPKDIDKVQKIIDISYSLQPKQIFDSNENRYAEFSVDSMQKEKEIIISAILSIHRNDLESNVNKPLWIKNSAKELITEFIGSEKYIETDNEMIKNKAIELKATDTLKTIENIYSFINKNLTYSGRNSEDAGAAKALELMKGDCSDFADLFVAICRANNIPARMVQGYTTDFNTAKHNWASVYINSYGWVYFDPTSGNSAGFYSMKNKYISLSTVRNDTILSNYHYWAYWYWGEPVKVDCVFDLR